MGRARRSHGHNHREPDGTTDLTNGIDEAGRGSRVRIRSGRTSSDYLKRRDHHLRLVDFDHHLDLHRDAKRQFGHPNGGACVTPDLVTE